MPWSNDYFLSWIRFFSRFSFFCLLSDTFGTFFLFGTILGTFFLGSGTFFWESSRTYTTDDLLNASKPIK